MTRPAKRPLPTREEQVKALKTHDEYDVLIVGGGATGAGCALDACTRGGYRFYFFRLRNSVKTDLKIYMIDDM